MEDPVFIGPFKGAEPTGLVPTEINQLGIEGNIIGPVEANSGNFARLGFPLNHGISTGVVGFIKFGDGDLG